MVESNQPVQRNSLFEEALALAAVGVAIGGAAYGGKKLYSGGKKVAGAAKKGANNMVDTAYGLKYGKKRQALTDEARKVINEDRVARGVNKDPLPMGGKPKYTKKNGTFDYDAYNNDVASTYKNEAANRESKRHYNEMKEYKRKQDNATRAAEVNNSIVNNITEAFF